MIEKWSSIVYSHASSDVEDSLLETVLLVFNLRRFFRLLVDWCFFSFLLFFRFLVGGDESLLTLFLFLFLDFFDSVAEVSDWSSSEETNSSGCCSL